MRGSRLLPCLTLFLLGATSPAADVPKLPSTLPITKLAPGKIVPNLCLLQHRVSTTSPECQAFVDQGLGYYYSYVWMEASRAFETATVHDPSCAMAWWELSRALEKWGRNSEATQALLKADTLKANASYAEQQLILARMQEKGQAPNVGDQEARKRAAISTVDKLLAIHDDDQEAWYYRAVLAGGHGFGGAEGSAPFFKALLKVNPLHPGANHEMVHFYENIRRPALGWPHAEKYMESSPGIPHAFHMQAHLGTRIGKWNKTTDYSSRAIDLQRTYHKELNVSPKQDGQYSHHLETLLGSLIHDGRFAEARACKAEAQKQGWTHADSWFRLHVGERDWAEALKVSGKRDDKTTSAYRQAIVHLKQSDTVRAAPHVEVLREALQKSKNNKRLEFRLWETQGLLLCMTGAGEAGLKLLERLVQKTKDDYGHHAWGNGAVYMESWGCGALAANRLDAAEEAFLEALAHDAGSVRAAMGLQVLCERQGRSEEARRYGVMARRFWSRATTQHFEAELSWIRNLGLGEKTSRK